MKLLIKLLNSLKTAMPIINMVYKKKKGWEYSYDFRNKTESQLITDGRTKNSGNRILNSNGMKVGSGNNDLNLSKSFPFSLTSARKITIQFTSILTTRSALYVGLREQATRGQAVIGWFDINNYQKGGGAILGNNITITGITPGTYTNKFVVDLSNKIATASVTGKSDLTYTLSDTQINTIRNNLKYIWINLWGWNQPDTTLQNLIMIVE